MRFYLHVEFRNDAMQSLSDLEQATRRMFSDFKNRTEEIEENEGETGSVYDLNGNRIGNWGIE